MIHEIDTVRRASDRNRFHHFAAGDIDYRDFANPAQRRPQRLAVGRDFHTIRPARHIDGADVFQGGLIDDVDRVRYAVRNEGMSSVAESAEVMRAVACLKFS